MENEITETMQLEIFTITQKNNKMNHEEDIDMGKQE